MSFVSACCIGAYTTLNFAVKTWLSNQKNQVGNDNQSNCENESESGQPTNAETIKVSFWFTLGCYD